MKKSVLDDVAGLGPTRKKRLVKELGGVTAVKQAPLETFLGLVSLTFDNIDRVYHLSDKLGLDKRGFVEEVRRCLVDPPEQDGVENGRKN